MILELHCDNMLLSGQCQYFSLLACDFLSRAAALTVSYHHNRGLPSSLSASEFEKGQPVPNSVQSDIPF
jgi:hypothetical protein